MPEKKCFKALWIFLPKIIFERNVYPGVLMKAAPHEMSISSYVWPHIVLMPHSYGEMWVGVFQKKICCVVTVLPHTPSIRASTI